MLECISPSEISQGMRQMFQNCDQNKRSGFQNVSTLERVYKLYIVHSIYYSFVRLGGKFDKNKAVAKGNSMIFQFC